MEEEYSYKQAEKALLQRSEYLNEIVQLQKSLGWKYLTDYIEQLIVPLKEQLLISTDIMEITRLQERIKSFACFYQAVSSFQQELTLRQQELVDIREEKAYREEIAD